MVDEAEHPRKPVPTVPRCAIKKDNDGFHYTVAQSQTHRGTSSPSIDVWWNRQERIRIGGRTTQDEMLIIRQQDDNQDSADVIICTLGQAYDLIDALWRAVENP